MAAQHMTHPGRPSPSIIEKSRAVRAGRRHCANPAASACAAAANIAELQEKAHVNGSSDDGQCTGNAAPTSETEKANAGRDSVARVAVQPAPHSHFEDFFGCRTREQSQAGRRGDTADPDATPRVRCLRHPLFETEVPYDAPSDARLQAALESLTLPPRRRSECEE